MIADIVDIARISDQKDFVPVPYLGFNAADIQPLDVLPIEEISSAYYLRVIAEDHPGVLAKIATIMSDLGINIESVMQKESEQDGDLIPLVLLTHEVQEKQINTAIEQIEALDTTRQAVVKIRVEHFNQ